MRLVQHIRRRSKLAALILCASVLCQSTAFSSNFSESGSQTPQTMPEGSGNAALIGYIAATYRKSVDYVRHIVGTTYSIAKQYSLPPNLLLAMMAKESAFEASAKNNYGATGLMQVVPRFHLDKLQRGESVASFTDPHTNIRVAANILSDYVRETGNLEMGLRKYSGNSGGYSQKVRYFWQKLEAVDRKGPRPQVPLAKIYLPQLQPEAILTIIEHTYAQGLLASPVDMCETPEQSDLDILDEGMAT